MLEKTMKVILTKKIKDWLSGIDNPDVVSAIKKDLVITGGCFTSFLQNEAPKDYDCYFKTKQTTKLVAEYYVDKWNEAHKGQVNRLDHEVKVFVLDGAEPTPEFLEYYHVEKIQDSASRMVANTPPERIKIIFPSDGVVGDPKAVRADEELGTAPENIGELDETDANEIIEKEVRNYFPVFLSTNAITLSDGIQVIVRFYGEPSDIHETFDFVHTKAYYTYHDSKLVIDKEVYEAVINKTLIYTGSKYPVCSIFRVRKFIERGWHINAGQLLKMCMQISELDLMNIDVLEDQLVGVDSLYFMNLIHQFQQMKLKNPEWILTTDYVVSVIDKIF